MARPEFPAIVAKEEATPILAEHYPRLVRAPDVSRSRAQNAFAIASAAAGSITAALLVNQSDRLDPLGVKLVAAALATWFLASGAYIAAVAIPLRHPPLAEPDSRKLAATVIKQAWQDRLWVDRLTVSANSIAVVALLATVAGFLTMVPEVHKPDTVAGRVLISKQLSDQLADRCGGVPPQELTGSIERTSLQKSWIILHTDVKQCPKDTLLRLPQSQVYGVESGLSE
ncbi:hypothetical protein [Streptomyces sp. E5N91]|uniref:hypothetical protein n=1 Tax=Streptomyces sp. E5N91 TaxID=1851996 RepID=UPI00129114E0|nr:hypothetical protein [Streptomyces sp. E5N91]